MTHAKNKRIKPIKAKAKKAVKILLEGQFGKSSETVVIEDFIIGYNYLNKECIYEILDLVKDSLLDFQWLLEEYRISLFAQQLKTRVPVSAKRLGKRWSDILDQLKILLPDYH